MLGPLSYLDPATPTLGRPSLDFKPSNFELSDAMGEPVLLAVTLADRFGGGAALLRNNVFPNEFFNRFYAERIPSDRSQNSLKAWWRGIIDNQPWIEWSPSTQSMKVRPKGAQVQILTALTASTQSLKLYRGTTTFEASMLDLIRALNTSSLRA